MISKTFLFTSEQRERSRAFDRLQADALSLLNQAPDNGFWRGYSQLVSAVIEQSFLPNVRHGTVSLPAGQRKQSNVPLLPVDCSQEQRLTLTGQLAEPTPAKLSMIARTLGRAAATDLYFPDWTLESASNLTGTAVTHYWHNAMDGHTIIGRPLIVARLQDTLGRDVTAYGTVHEYVHALDVERWDLSAVDFGIPANYETHGVAMELHAYAAGGALRPYPVMMNDRDRSIMDSSYDAWSAQGYSHEEMPYPSEEVARWMGGLGLV
jgi:hypothetical protein